MTTHNCLSTNFATLRTPLSPPLPISFMIYPTLTHLIPHLFLGKARVAPFKQHTITKLELQAVELATRIANFVNRESTLPITQTFYESDSSTVIQWIWNSNERQQIFIAKRVFESLETSTVNQWRHSPGDIDIVDDATRDIPIADLTYHCRWFTGPAFQMKTPENWPTDIVQTSSQPAVSDKSINAVFHRAQLTQTIKFPNNFTKFSSPFRFVRITAFVYRGSYFP